MISQTCLRAAFNIYGFICHVIFSHVKTVARLNRMTRILARMARCLVHLADPNVINLDHTSKFSCREPVGRFPLCFSGHFPSCLAKIVSTG